MDENLRVALVQFLNSRGQAPHPASSIAVHPGYGRYEAQALEIWFHDAHDTYASYDMHDVDDLLLFLLNYQVT